MPVRESYQHGTPSWVDLSTTDPEGAKSFYGALFGWSFNDEPAGDQGVYTMARKGEHAAAGMMQQAPEQAAMGIPSMWNTYVTVNDVDATVAAVPDAGGNVMMPSMDVMESGRMAVVVDPTGAVLGLWEPKNHIGCEVINEHGALTWNEVTTPDVASAAPFYSALFGWETEDMQMPHQVYTIFNLEGEGIGGAMAPMMDGIPPHWGTVFHVDDVAAATETAQANGGVVLNGPMDIGVGTLSVIQDPQGAVFQMLQPAAEQ